MEKILPWVEKYRPVNTKEVQGQNKIVERILDFVNNYKNQRTKAILLYGKPGSGKSSICMAVSNELDMELVEVNASDSRNKNSLQERVGNAISQQSLFSFGKGKLILIDEIDGLSGFKDRGASTEIVSIIKKSTYPIIMTANDPWDKKFATLRKNAEMIEIQTLAYTSIVKVLKKICETEKINYDEDTLKSFARHQGGDLRGAINDLQSIAGSKKSLQKEDLEILSERRQLESMPQSLMKIFKTTDLILAKTAFDDSPTNQDEQILWLEENIPKEYETPSDRANAFDFLSKADIYRRRIRRRQDWRYMAYIGQLLTCGICAAKKEKYKKFLPYKQGDRILKMWIANNANSKRKNIAEKIAMKTHQSSKKIIKESIFFYKYLAKKDKIFCDKFQNEFELDKDEIAWILK